MNQQPEKTNTKSKIKVKRRRVYQPNIKYIAAFVVFVCMIVVTFFSYLYLESKNPVFESQATIVIDQIKQEQFYPYNYQNYYIDASIRDKHVAALTSDKFLELVSANQDIIAILGHEQDHKGIWDVQYGIPGWQAKKQTETALTSQDVVRRIEQSLQVSFDEKKQHINIRVRDKNAFFVQKLSQLLPELYRETQNAEKNNHEKFIGFDHILKENSGRLQKMAGLSHKLKTEKKHSENIITATFKKTVEEFIKKEPETVFGMIRILKKSTPVALVSAKNRQIYILVSAVVGLILGLLVAGIWLGYAKRFKTEKDISDYLNVPVLGMMKKNQ